MGKPIKLAHKLNSSILSPKSIEKTSTKFASAIFHESTVSALRYYATSSGNDNFKNTADFLEYIHQYWRIINVRSPVIGKHLRDIYRDPIRSSEDWKLSFLEKFNRFLNTWRSSKEPGLTEETYFALSQTTSSFQDFSRYLINRLGYNYILLGKVTSDNLEERFGWYR